jgi:hypothetical protein
MVPLLNYGHPTAVPIPMKPDALRLDDNAAQRDVEDVSFGSCFYQVYAGLFRHLSHIRAGFKPSAGAQGNCRIHASS